MKHLKLKTFFSFFLILAMLVASTSQVFAGACEDPNSDSVFDHDAANLTWDDETIVEDLGYARYEYSRCTCNTCGRTFLVLMGVTDYDLSGGGDDDSCKTKHAQTIHCGCLTRTVRSAKKKARSFMLKKSSSEGTAVTCKKISGSKCLTISKKGKITVKKGTKKGAYRIKIRLSARETATAKAATITRIVKVKVS